MVHISTVTIVILLCSTLQLLYIVTILWLLRVRRQRLRVSTDKLPITQRGDGQHHGGGAVNGGGGGGMHGGNGRQQNGGGGRGDNRQQLPNDPHAHTLTLPGYYSNFLPNSFHSVEQQKDVPGGLGINTRNGNAAQQGKGKMGGRQQQVIGDVPFSYQTSNTPLNGSSPIASAVQMRYSPPQLNLTQQQQQQMNPSSANSDSSDFLLHPDTGRMSFSLSVASASHRAAIEHNLYDEEDHFKHSTQAQYGSEPNSIMDGVGAGADGMVVAGGTSMEMYSQVPENGVNGDYNNNNNNNNGNNVNPLDNNNIESIYPSIVITGVDSQQQQQDDALSDISVVMPLEPSMSSGSSGGPSGSSSSGSGYSADEQSMTSPSNPVAPSSNAAHNRHRSENLVSLDLDDDDVSLSGGGGTTDGTTVDRNVELLIDNELPSISSESSGSSRILHISSIPLGVPSSKSPSKGSKKSKHNANSTSSRFHLDSSVPLLDANHPGSILQQASSPSLRSSQRKTHILHPKSALQVNPLSATEWRNRRAGRMKKHPIGGGGNNATSSSNITSVNNSQTNSMTATPTFMSSLPTAIPTQLALDRYHSVPGVSSAQAAQDVSAATNGNVNGNHNSISAITNSHFNASASSAAASSNIPSTATFSPPPADWAASPRRAKVKFADSPRDREAAELERRFRMGSRDDSPTRFGRENMINGEQTEWQQQDGGAEVATDYVNPSSRKLGPKSESGKGSSNGPSSTAGSSSPRVGPNGSASVNGDPRLVPQSVLSSSPARTTQPARSVLKHRSTVVTPTSSPTPSSSSSDEAPLLVLPIYYRYLILQALHCVMWCLACIILLGFGKNLVEWDSAQPGEGGKTMLFAIVMAGLMSAHACVLDGLLIFLAAKNVGRNSIRFSSIFGAVWGGLNGIAVFVAVESISAPKGEKDGLLPMWHPFFIRSASVVILTLFILLAPGWLVCHTRSRRTNLCRRTPGEKARARAKLQAKLNAALSGGDVEQLKESRRNNGWNDGDEEDDLDDDDSQDDSSTNIDQSESDLDQEDVNSQPRNTWFFLACINLSYYVLIVCAYLLDFIESSGTIRWEVSIMWLLALGFIGQTPLLYYCLSRDSKYWMSEWKEWLRRMKTQAEQEEQAREEARRARGERTQHQSNLMRSSSFTPALPSLAQNNFFLDYSVLEYGALLGSGGFSSVYAGKLWGHLDVAVKVLHVRDMSKEIVEQFLHEVGIILQLKHPNIVHFMGVVFSPPDMVLVMEKCRKQSLLYLIKQQKVRFTEFQAVSIGLAIADALRYIHEQDIIHRDLKAANILFDISGKPKVCDFGLSEERSKIDLNRVFCGTLAYMSPEVLRNETVSKGSDVYSFSIILWELLHNELAWKRSSKDKKNGFNARILVEMVAYRRARPPVKERQVNMNEGGSQQKPTPQHAIPTDAVRIHPQAFVSDANGATSPQSGSSSSTSHTHHASSSSSSTSSTYTPRPGIHPILANLLRECWRDDYRRRPSFTDIVRRLSAFREMIRGQQQQQQQQQKNQQQHHQSQQQQQR